MSQQVLRVTLLLNGLMIVIILAMRLMPNDDTAIRALLLPPEGCPAPCFMNIRAGITDSVQAARLVSQSAWAQSPPFFMRSQDDMYSRFVFWRWSGQQPPGIDSRRQGQMRIYKDQAVGMVINTTLPLGEVWLALGATDKGTLSLAQSLSLDHRMVVMAYPKLGLLLRVVVPKHVTQAELWASITEVESSSQQNITYFGGFHLPSLARLGQE